MVYDAQNDLALPQRLALSYAPAASREAALTLMLLDNRLSGILQSGSEIIIAQMKLAWWRDRLSEPAANWPAGEPLLERLRNWPADHRALLSLVNGWEALMAEDLSQTVLRDYAQGRAGGWAALSRPLSPDFPVECVQRTAHNWALADLALHLDSPEEAERAKQLALLGPEPELGTREGTEAGTGRITALPRALRPLSVQHGLTLRALKRGKPSALYGPGALIAALRIGLTGR